LTQHWAQSRARDEASTSALRAMKPLNVFPMVILLIAIIFLIIWLRPH
jgi:hypothetical protein